MARAQHKALRQTIMDPVDFTRVHTADRPPVSFACWREETMALQPAIRRWIIVCLGVLLGALCMNAAAIDPGSVKGKLTHKGKVYPSH